MPGVPLADFALGPDGKLLIVNGRYQLVEDHEARAQCLKIALQHMMGEWYRDENAGTDIRGKLVGKAKDLERRSEIRRRCLSVPGITTVNAINIKNDRVTRRMEISVQTVASDGTVITASATTPGG